MNGEFEFTEEELKAIASLKRAFSKCKKLKLSFSGMSQTLLVANEKAVTKANKNRVDKYGDYNPVALAHQECYGGTDCVVDGDPYVDSGGW